MNKLREMALEKVGGPEAVAEGAADGKAEMEEALEKWETMNGHAIELADMGASLDRGRVECIVNRLYEATGAHWYEEGFRDGARMMLELLGKDTPACDFSNG